MTTASGDSQWLRRRLGCTGKSRGLLLEQLRTTLINEDLPTVQLGLRREDIQNVVPDHQADQLATGLPTRGDRAQLHQIAWWGSALGDIAAAQRCNERDAIVAEAGMFNLAVALFDTVVEDRRDWVSTLAAATAPTAMKARLLAPRDERLALAVEHPVLHYVVALFDRMLAGVGTRLQDHPSRLQELGALLDVMFRSELGLESDPFAAKTLPIVFIGALGEPISETCTTRLFAALAHYLSLWDDWLDMADDMRHLRPNAFLGHCRPRVSFDTARYGVRSGARVLLGEHARDNVNRQLVTAFRKTLDLARACDDPTYLRVVALHQALLA